jgi:hypothetical protein
MQPKGKIIGHSEPAQKRQEGTQKSTLINENAQ